MVQFRDLTKYRWVKDFHKVLWERIKQSNPDLPKWSWDQLVANGWGVKLSNERGKIELIHKDGSVKKFYLSINGQVMPHMSAMFSHIWGWSHTGLTQQDIREVEAKLRQDFPNLNLSWNGRIFWVRKGNQNLNDYLFRHIQDVPLDTSYKLDPRCTTSQAYVRGILEGSNFNYSY